MRVYRQHELHELHQSKTVDVSGPLVNTFSDGPHWRGFADAAAARAAIDAAFTRIRKVIDEDRRQSTGDEVLDDGRRVWRSL